MDGKEGLNTKYLLIKISFTKIPHLKKHSLKNHVYNISSESPDFNPFHATGIFLHPLKTSEKFWFSGVLRGY